MPGPHVEVSGGDGFEVQNLVVASLAKNCLNTSLWDVLFFVKENGKKAMNYQGWFTFPLGHYRRIWEANTGLSYCSDLNWHRVEHWLDPTCTPITLQRLRMPCSETFIDAQFRPCEPIVYDGEQLRKSHTSNMCGQQTWCDVLSAGSGSYATFLSRVVIASTSLGATSIGVWRHSKRQSSDRSNALPVRIRDCMKSG